MSSPEVDMVHSRPTGRKVVALPNIVDSVGKLQHAGSSTTYHNRNMTGGAHWKTPSRVSPADSFKRDGPHLRASLALPKPS